jgi:hypothetical protein
MSLRWMFASAAFALTSAAGAAALAQPAPPPAPPPPGAGTHTEIIRSETDANGDRTITIERDGKVTVQHVGKEAREAGRLAGEHAREEVRRVMIRRDPAERRAHEADHLRAILQLRPNQEAALQAYLTSMEPPKPEAMADHMAHMEPGADHPKTTPERLAEQEKMLAEHEARAHAHINAVKSFYGQLDPAQKKAFDELPPMEHGMMGGPMMIRINGPHMEMHGLPPMPPMPPMPPRAPNPPPAPGL